MRNASAILISALIIVGTSSRANAQESGRVGLTMAYPGSVGVMLNVTDRFGIRPDFDFSTSSGELASSDASGHAFDVGISGLFYLTEKQAFRPYGSVRFGYGRNITENTARTVSAAQVKTTATLKSVTGSLGAQYSLHRHFSVFGETGVRYNSTDSDQKSSFASLVVSTKVHAWGTRAGAGIIVYF